MKNPNNDISTVYMIVIFILVMLLLWLASWYGSRTYSKNACMATTNSVNCSPVEAR